MAYKTWDLLRKRLILNLEPHGAVSEFSRKTGFSRAGVDKWLNNLSVPKIDVLDKFADALDQKPWQLIQPDEDKAHSEMVIPLETLQRINKLDERQKKLFLNSVNTMLDALLGDRKKSERETG